jgi:hypothetical protein
MLEIGLRTELAHVDSPRDPVGFVLRPRGRGSLGIDGRTKEEAMAEEITLEREVDRILGLQATVPVTDELVWEREPFEDQRAFASVAPEEPIGREDPEETEAGSAGPDTDTGGPQDDEDDEDDDE